MLFKYKAIGSGGEKISNSAEAKDKFDLARQLKAEGKLLIFAEEEGHKTVVNMTYVNAFLSRVTMQDKIIFARNLSAMVHAGLSLSRGMNILERQTKNEKFKKILRTVGDDIKEGSSLGDSMKKHPSAFSSLFVAMVRAGEESGSLTQSLKLIGSQMEKSYNLQRKIRGALVYPAIIMIAMVIVGALMMIFVVPTLTSTFKELSAELPLSTQFIIFVSDVLIAHTVAIFSLLAVVIVMLIAFFRTQRGKRILDFTFLRIPIIGKLVKKTNSARTTRTLSSLLSSGVDIVEALGITGDVLQNSYYKEVVAEAREGIQKGRPLSSNFLKAEGLYPLMVGEMMEVGEETGQLSEMLLEIADFYEGEVEEATKSMATIIEPFLMIVVGAVVGFFAIAMISPTYSLLSNI
ncbi:MAG: type II secretion system F family protein [Patescibacteria group bacterium]|nr:type II secretion system F family protein [Patescibacteria group bacterium]